MTFFYSPSENLVYDNKIRGSIIPQDANIISESTFKEILIARSSGKYIKPDNNGNPLITNEIPEEIILSNLIASAKYELVKTDMVAIRCIKSGVDFPTEWKNYVLELRNISNGNCTINTTLPLRPEYPEGT